ncbi:headcase [Anopheles sinensis]|uniref:Headcase n=1 Tax=Anopheles sinensis TaxID=74873 RepID=A0A084VBM1_ANOSI|nr:headcase [Anopheles sinensis]
MFAAGSSNVSDGGSTTFLLVKYENRVQYLTSVCLKCLQGIEPNRTVRCR